MTKEDIVKICKKYNINNYTINPDMSIDVDGNVNLNNKNLTNIQLNFNKVTGEFNCSDNKLTSLKGCPNYVGDNFCCFCNHLPSLEYSPKYVGGKFICDVNSFKIRNTISLANGILHVSIYSNILWKF